LFEQYRIGISQFVQIRGRNWHLADFQKPENRTWAFTSDGKDEWVQVEIVAE
jgi:hypothetical protein